MGLPHRRFPKLATGASLWAPALLVLALAPVPFWGARESSPIGTDPAKLKPGQFIWGAAAAPEGPIVIVVSLPEQIARVYRNGVEVGLAKVSTGKPGHITPAESRATPSRTGACICRRASPSFSSGSRASA
jgi:hypothetical protein